MTIRFRIACLLLFLLPANKAYQASTNEADHLLDPFASGWMLSDTNGDGIVDFVSGKVVVPANPTAAENAAAADIAVRLGFSSTGLTLPLVIGAADDRNDGPRIWVGREAVPGQYLSAIGQYADRLQPEEGGVFALEGNLALIGHDDAGLLAAAEAFASRSPYLWKVPGDRLTVLADAVRAKTDGLTSLNGKAG